MRDVLIHSLDDPRVSAYRDVTGADKRESGTHFIAEGENVVLRLLASDFRCVSVLCVDRKASRIRPHLQDETQLLIAPESLLQDIVGFKFHSGVMAVGLRKEPLTLQQVMFASPSPLAGEGRVGSSSGRERDQQRETPPPTPSRKGRGTETLLICPEITDSANLGSLIRIAAAFGVTAIVLGERCRDAFTRQTVRVSMGTIFSLPIVRSDDITRDLKRLQSEFDVELVATVLDVDAEPLENAERRTRVGLLLGNEGPGLDREIVASCDRRVTIPMMHGTDSLNVSVAAGVFLYHFTRCANVVATRA